MLKLLFNRLAFSTLTHNYHFETFGGWRQAADLSHRPPLSFFSTQPSNTFTWARLQSSATITLQAPAAYRYGFNKAVWPLKDALRLEGLQLSPAPSFANLLAASAPFTLDRKGISKKTAMNVGLWVRCASAAPLLPWTPPALRTWPFTFLSLCRAFKDTDDALIAVTSPDIAFLSLDPVLTKFAQEANPLEAAPAVNLPALRLPRQTHLVQWHTELRVASTTLLLRKTFFLLAVVCYGRSKKKKIRYPAPTIFKKHTN